GLPHRATETWSKDHTSLSLENPARERARHCRSGNCRFRRSSPPEGTGAKLARRGPALHAGGAFPFSSSANAANGAAAVVRAATAFKVSVNGGVDSLFTEDTI